MTPVPINTAAYRPAELERAWLSTGSVASLLEVLGGEAALATPGAQRKLRLFLCSLIHEAAPRLTDARIDAACRAAEEFADGRTHELRLDDGYWAAREAVASHHEELGPDAGGAALAAIACQRPFATIESIALVLPFWAQAAGVPLARQAELFRDVFGNPFRIGATAASQDWLAGTVWQRGIPTRAWADALDPRLTERARHIYERGAWDSLGQLGAALPLVGEFGEEVLQHCLGRSRCPECLGAAVSPELSAACNSCSGAGWVRNSVPHTRGCWVLDLVLGH